MPNIFSLGHDEVLGDVLAGFFSLLRREQCHWLWQKVAVKVVVRKEFGCAPIKLIRWRCLSLRCRRRPQPPPCSTASESNGRRNGLAAKQPFTDPDDSKREVDSRSVKAHNRRVDEDAPFLEISTRTPSGFPRDTIPLNSALSSSARTGATAGSLFLERRPFDILAPPVLEPRPPGRKYPYLYFYARRLRGTSRTWISFLHPFWHAVAQGRAGALEDTRPSNSSKMAISRRSSRPTLLSPRVCAPSRRRRGGARANHHRGTTESRATPNPALTLPQEAQPAQAQAHRAVRDRRASPHTGNLAGPWPSCPLAPPPSVPCVLSCTHPPSSGKAQPGRVLPRDAAHSRNRDELPVPPVSTRPSIDGLERVHDLPAAWRDAPAMRVCSVRVGLVDPFCSIHVNHDHHPSSEIQN
ncbi:hypothetical protein C8R45DRAFT_1123857 [Mycena sanguinolenta]|nr:hypothetical protein C8R45DRAFT_1123857 [Mycena sanguinolenta]